MTAPTPAVIDPANIAARALAFAGLSSADVDDKAVALTLDAVLRVPEPFAGPRSRAASVLNDESLDAQTRARAWLAMVAIDAARGIGREVLGSRSLAETISARIEAARLDRSIAWAYGHEVEACAFSLGAI